MQLGSIRNRVQKALSNMKRQIFLAKVILVAFFSCSVCLPLDHICLEAVASSITTPAGQAATSFGAHAFRSPSGSPEWAGVRPVSRESGPCLACLWSQTLLLQKAISGFGVPQFISSDAILSRSPRVAITISYDAASKRGPPAFPIA